MSPSATIGPGRRPRRGGGDGTRTFAAWSGIRRVSDRTTARCRRNGRRLPRPPPASAETCCAEATYARRDRRRRCACPLPARGRPHRAPRPPEYRRCLRPRRPGRAVVDCHAVHRRVRRRGGATRRSAAGGARRADHYGDRQGTRLRPRRRRAAPRHQTRQHHAHPTHRGPARTSLAGRLRHCQRPRRPHRDHRHRHVPRQPAIRRPRATRPLDHPRWPSRRVRPGLHPVPPAHRITPPTPAARPNS